MSQPNKTPLYPSDKTSDDTLPQPLYASKDEYKLARSALLDYLAATYPTHFGTEGKPWAIGIREELLAALSELKAYPPLLVTQALHHFTRSVSYLTNCALSGLNTDRVRLDGNAEGVVSRRELIYALTQLSGLVSRKDKEQGVAYREWALREMVLGLLHDDITVEGLEQSRVRKKVVLKAIKLSQCAEITATLKLRHKRTGELHPAVYAAPYLNDGLYKQFKDRHPDHVTSRKSKAKRTLLFPQEVSTPATSTLKAVELNVKPLRTEKSLPLGSRQTKTSTPTVGFNDGVRKVSKNTTTIINKRRRTFDQSLIG